MFWPDWEHYVEVLQQPATTTPAARNTLFWAGDTTAPIARDSAIAVSLEQLLEQLEAMRNEHIVFVARALQLVAPLPRELDTQLQIATDTSCDFFVLDPKWPQT